MFGFSDMMFNYNDRKVANYEGDNFTIDTCRVTDSSKPYETAIACDEFNGGKWVIVEQYNNSNEAQEGHNKWVEIFNKNIPDTIPSIDVWFNEIETLKKNN